MKKNKKNLSELRRDVVSGDWVVISDVGKRKPRPIKIKEEVVGGEKDCVFCNIETQETPLLVYSKSKGFSYDGQIPEDWLFVTIPNKFPFLSSGDSLNRKEEGGGLYQSMDGIGHCELVLGKDHKKNIFGFSNKEINTLLTIFQKRYIELAKDPLVNYISIFQNYGTKAGASQPHPHFQIITTPLIDVNLTESIRSSQKYFNEKKECIYCKMIEWDKKKKERVVYENDDFIAICPFASKVSFQVVISPKKHLSNFEKITDREKLSLADIFSVVFKSLDKTLSNPSYNLYLHTSPCDGHDYSYYHWHWGIMPRANVWAGFELGTHMEICGTEPERAAQYLRENL